MPKVEFEDILPYRAADLYRLVMEIERYPEIFEDISAVTVRHTGPERRSVDVTLNAPLMRVSYSCEVEGTPPPAEGGGPGRIDIRATRGMFRSMEASWQFESLDDGRTRVGYRMEFDFGGIGFMNAAAAGLIEAQVQKTKEHLKSYAAQKLALRDPLPPPPAMTPPGLV